MKESIDLTNVPVHIAVIMDGNGRWAKQQGVMDRVFGHRSASKAVRETIERCGELGVQYLTLYAFSTENWNRPKSEVAVLMSLLSSAINDELPELIEKNVRLIAVGDLDRLPSSTRADLEKAIAISAKNTGLTVNLALSYSGKWDLVQATQQIAEKVKNGELDVESIDSNTIQSHLSTVGMPDPDLLIRTGGDHRISNFMLWQLAYSELYIFEDLFWPDFRKEHLNEAIVDFQMRERRFGKISEQLN